MNNDDSGFLKVIRENPTDDTHRLIYADWLEERGDVRGEYLQLECELARIRARVEQLRPQIDPSWMAEIFNRWSVVVYSFSPEKKIAVIKTIREVTNFGLKESHDLAENLPAFIGDYDSFEAAARARLLSECSVVQVQRFTGFYVILDGCGGQPRSEAIIAVRRALGCGIRIARNIVEERPSLLKICQTKLEVERLRATLPADFKLVVSDRSLFV